MRRKNRTAADSVSLQCVGSIGIAERWCKGPGISEVGSYIGLPGLIILLSFGITSWKEQRGRRLIILFATTTILSFGRTLIIFGHPLYPISWRLITYLPLIGMALPSRLSVYPSLIFALVFALWLSRGPDWVVAPPQPYSNIFAENTQYVLELEYDRPRLAHAAESARLLLRETRKSNGHSELPLAGR